MPAKKAESGTGWLAKNMAAGAVRAFAFHVTVVYIIPLGIPAVTIYLGFVQGLPWMYIVVGACVAFAGISAGLVRFDDWREKRRVDGKIGFVQVRSSADTTKPSVALGALFQSTAAIPIEVEIEEVRTQVDSRVPANRTFEKTKFTVPPHGNLFFDDHRIEIAQYPRTGTLSGIVEFRLRYGRQGNMKYIFHIKKNTVLTFDAEGRYIGGSWSDAA
jgi:hypothetical protein